MQNTESEKLENEAIEFKLTPVDNVIKKLVKKSGLRQVDLFGDDLKKVQLRSLTYSEQVVFDYLYQEFPEWRDY